jgi:hypothetical protein
MTSEADANDTQIVLPEPEETFHVRDERTANWVLRLIVGERDYRKRIAAWYEAETRRSERREQFLFHRFGAELEAWTRQQLASQHGSRRSVQLPAGVLGFRVEPTKLVIADERALITWCHTHLPAAVKVVEHVLKNEITSHLKATGECPPGAELAGGGDKFFVK